MTNITHPRFNPRRVIPERWSPAISAEPTIRLQNVRHRPVCWGGRIFASFVDGHVRAYGHPDWNLLWEQRVEPAHRVDLHLVLSNGLLYFVCGAGLYQCDPAAGEISLVRAVGRECNFDTALLTDGLLFHNAHSETSDRMHLACEFVAGGDRWSFPLESAMYRSALEGNVFLCAQPSSPMLAIDVRDGLELWRLPGPICSWPLISESRVYCGLPHNRVLCLDAATGADIWQTEIPVPFPNNLTLYPDGNLYTMDGAHISIIQAGDGSLVRSHDVLEVCEKLDIYSASDLLVTDGRVWMADVRGGNFACFDTATGSLLWHSSVRGFLPFINTPFVAERELLVLNGDGTLLSF